jgi:hypothetical protein
MAESYIYNIGRAILPKFLQFQGLEMETTGIEPATSWLQTRRSPN